MTESLKMAFHHIGKPISLEAMVDCPNVKYSPLFDTYSLDLKNSLSIPIELQELGKNLSLHPRIQQKTHIASKVNNIALAKGFWRYRAGHFRIICKIDDERLIVLVLKIAHSKEVY